MAATRQTDRDGAVDTNRLDDNDLPDRYENLDELASSAPPRRNTQTSLEDIRRDQAELQCHSSPTAENPARLADTTSTTQPHFSKLATQLYTHSYLIFFSILGTLARVGLSSLTKYPGTPIAFSTLWANFAGSLVLGFLVEDRKLFRHEWGTPTYGQKIDLKRSKAKAGDEENGTAVGSGNSSRPPVDTVAAKKAHLATKKTIPLYIGLATGFCGSFTSFSTFIRDAFLAMSNDLNTSGDSRPPESRNGGYSFMALLAVITTHVCLSLSGYIAGIHAAGAVEACTPAMPFKFMRKVVDPVMAVVAWGCWLGAVLMAIFPPHDFWRGRAVFAIVFAPIGCLLRFYLALYLNARIPSFPLGTFVANVLGTAILGVAWDVAHIPAGGLITCQVMQGLEDGLCGCLTTVSTWVSELSSLRRRHAYFYGAVSVLAAFALSVATMGGLRWSKGFDRVTCTIP